MPFFPMQPHLCTLGVNITEVSPLCVMRVAMAQVAALNTLGEDEWSSMAAINCL